VLNKLWNVSRLVRKSVQLKINDSGQVIVNLKELYHSNDFCADFDLFGLNLPEPINERAILGNNIIFEDEETPLYNFYKDPIQNDARCLAIAINKIRDMGSFEDIMNMRATGEKLPDGTD